MRKTGSVPISSPHPFVCVQVPGELPAPGAALTADFWLYAP